MGIIINGKNWKLMVEGVKNKLSVAEIKLEGVYLITKNNITLKDINGNYILAKDGE
jgi:hypothetical protein